MNRISWTPIARESLKEAITFIIKIWGEDVKIDFIRALEKQLENLRQFPESGSLVQKGQFRKIVVHETISIFYLHQSDEIKVLLVWDNRQNPDNLYEKLMVK